MEPSSELSSDRADSPRRSAIDGAIDGAATDGAGIDPEFLAASYREHFPALIKVAHLMLDSAAAAEDAVHEVFLRCAPRLPELDHPRSYLRRSLINECRKQLRHGRRQRVDRVEVAAEDLPHDVLETRRALGVLSERQRAAVVLRYFVDIPDVEIARILDCRPATVRSLLHRALKQLEEELR